MKYVALLAPDTTFVNKYVAPQGAFLTFVEKYVAPRGPFVTFVNRHVAPLSPSFVFLAAGRCNKEGVCNCLTISFGARSATFFGVNPTRACARRPFVAPSHWLAPKSRHFFDKFSREFGNKSALYGIISMRYFNKSALYGIISMPGYIKSLSCVAVQLKW